MVPTTDAVFRMGRTRIPSWPEAHPASLERPYRFSQTHSPLLPVSSLARPDGPTPYRPSHFRLDTFPRTIDCGPSLRWRSRATMPARPPPLPPPTPGGGPTWWCTSILPFDPERCAKPLRTGSSTPAPSAASDRISRRERRIIGHPVSRLAPGRRHQTLRGVAKPSLSSG